MEIRINKKPRDVYRAAPFPAMLAKPHLMRQRNRKLIGTVALLVLVIFWALFGMLVAQGRVVELPGYAQVFVFLFLGMVWVLPAGFIIRWMARKDA
ncbi:MAG: DUF2842 domain-containing protein [Xanthobacteraceae bacterium]